MLNKLLDKFDMNTKFRGAIKAGVFLASVVIVAFLWNAFIISPYKVSGISMEPSMEEGDLVIVNRLSYMLSEPERYDIILFSYKYDNNRKLIKRVIGLPGETVQIKDGEIYINDEKLDEYYGVYNAIKYTGESIGSEIAYMNWGPVKLGEDEIFVLGDNRNNSEDSRSSDVGLVKIDDIVGKVTFRIWPFNSIGSMRGQ